MTDLDTLYCIDMDRCLLDTDRVMEHVRAILEELGVDHGAAIRERKAAVTRGGRLDMWAHLKHHILEKYNITESALVELFLRHAPDGSYVYPGATKLLNDLNGRVIVMTYGNPVWQQLKARLSGIDQHAPVLVVDTHKKGRLIARSEQGGRYNFSVGDTEWSAETVVLVDDKAEAFDGLPADCRGYHLHHGEWYDFQRGQLPPHAMLLDGSFEALRAQEQL